MQISELSPFKSTAAHVSGITRPAGIDREARGAPSPGGDSPASAWSVEISPRARELSHQSGLNYGNGAHAGTSSAASPVAGNAVGANAVGPVKCQTCESRRYKDESGDSSVSFQTAARIAPGAEESQVRAHEQEHVSHERLRAKEKGDEVVSQSVQIHYSICPECGKTYVAGGTTTTTTRGKGGGHPYVPDSGNDMKGGVSIRA